MSPTVRPRSTCACLPAFCPLSLVHVLLLFHFQQFVVAVPTPFQNSCDFPWRRICSLIYAEFGRRHLFTVGHETAEEEEEEDSAARAQIHTLILGCPPSVELLRRWPLTYLKVEGVIRDSCFFFFFLLLSLIISVSEGRPFTILPGTGGSTKDIVIGPPSITKNFKLLLLLSLMANLSGWTRTLGLVVVVSCFFGGGSSRCFSSLSLSLCVCIYVCVVWCQAIVRMLAAAAP